MQVRVRKLLKLKIASRVAGIVLATGVGAKNVLSIGNGHGQGAAPGRSHEELGMRDSTIVNGANQMIFDIFLPDDL